LQSFYDCRAPAKLTHCHNFKALSFALASRAFGLGDRRRYFDGPPREVHRLSDGLKRHNVSRDKEADGATTGASESDRGGRCPPPTGALTYAARTGRGAIGAHLHSDTKRHRTTQTQGRGNASLGRYLATFAPRSTLLHLYCLNRVRECRWSIKGRDYRPVRRIWRAEPANRLLVSGAHAFVVLDHLCRITGRNMMKYHRISMA
jgi:hypothetical protein